ncbi:Endonuclease/exonuclease/phosphatase superfamily [Sesbania bispinosa]|nr:Endonuclease/exonuclease/phosphatase superfamily [Sesbania bispinosa]
MRNGHPWCCMGDFNEILSPDEKVGLQPPNSSGINLFREFLNDTGLMEVELKGCKFTWCSNPRNGFTTKEKLDRVLVNWAWRNLFEHASATALPAVSSDHSPIIFWPKPKDSSGRSFKYEAMWEEHPEVNEIIHTAWTEAGVGENSWDTWRRKTRKCTARLKSWHKEKFKKASERMGVSVLRSFGRCLINSGDDILIEEDPWLCDGAKTEIQQGATASKVSDLLDPSTGGWNIQAIRENIVATQFQKVLQTPVGSSSHKDAVFWPYSSSGFEYFLVFFSDLSYSSDLLLDLLTGHI